MKTTATAAALSACLCLLAPLPALATDEDAATARLVEELGLRESEVALRDRPGWASPKKVVLMGAVKQPYVDIGSGDLRELFGRGLYVLVVDEDVGAHGRSEPRR